MLHFLMLFLISWCISANDVANGIGPLTAVASIINMIIGPCLYRATGVILLVWSGNKREQLKQG